MSILGHKTTYHFGISKRHILLMIRQNGAKSLDPDWEGTEEEAMQSIRDNPLEVFGVDCDNRAANGRCLGHFN